MTTAPIRPHVGHTPDPSSPLTLDHYRAALQRSELRPGVRFILATLADHADATTLTVQRSQSELAKLTGYTPDTVQRHLKAAITAGWIAIDSEPTNNSGTRYALTLPAAALATVAA